MNGAILLDPDAKLANGWAVPCCARPPRPDSLAFLDDFRGPRPYCPANVDQAVHNARSLVVVAQLLTEGALALLF
jgi:hypothetical protein